MRTGIDRFTGKGRETSIRVRQDRSLKHASDLVPIIDEVRASGTTTLRGIATALNERGIPAARGGRWSAVQVRRVLIKTV
ncbi:recombinase family protein [Methylobacterium tarhaniae]|uniref:recombinase family protein n=1 Tax=Methylobacterium tarhaniae TaxID=1187852 RepID=UPI003D052B3C